MDLRRCLPIRFRAMIRRWRHRFLGAHFMRRLATLEATPDPLPEPLWPAATESQQLFQPRQTQNEPALCHYLDRHESFHELPKIAEATPAGS